MNWILCKCGDVINPAYIKKIYVWYDGFPPNRTFQVRAEIDGGAKGDESKIVDIFNSLDDAKKFIANLVNG